MTDANEGIYTRDELLVIAMDLGTTNSAVGYSHMYPGTVPTIQMVTKWPGQPEASGDSKIPSLIAYKDKDPVAFGHEALGYENEEDYEIAKWFKLRLHPDSMKTTDQPPAYGADDLPQMELPPLPRLVTLGRVYEDLMRYLFQNTRLFFENVTPNGHQIWKRLEKSTVFVFCTPNAWDVSQQGFLRKAAVRAGLVSASEASSLIEFVTEAEASVHYAVKHTKGDLWLQKGAVFAIVDAGGSTIDSTLYECKESKPRIVLEEVCASECIQAGGIFVDRAMRKALKAKLGSSRFSKEEIINLMVHGFERKVKRTFDGSQSTNVISFGRSTENDRSNGVIKGKLSLTDSEVAGCFKAAIGGVCSKLLRGHEIKHLLLAGGFGESPYLQKALKVKFESQGTQVITVTEPLKKPAAEGSLIWYTRQLVVARAARFTIGTSMHRRFHASDRLHQKREHKVVVRADGHLILDDFFDPMLEKGVVVPQNEQRQFRYSHNFKSLPSISQLTEFKESILSWEGPGRPVFHTDEQGATLPQMRTACTLVADLSRLSPALMERTGINGHKYWSVEFSIVLELGRTQLQARLQWMEGDKKCEGPITIIPGSMF